MLSRIHIQNFAISSEAEVELNKGMTVLTGETGAGKSILIDALDLVLGDRADSNVIRHGADRATINASFIVADNSAAHDWLKNQELDDGDECHLRRIISAECRSRAFINNTPANLSSLKELGEMLIEIHGQHEHQSLMKAAKQRQQLDSAGDYNELLNEIETLAIEIRQRQQALNELQSNIDENSAQMELLNYQLKELEALGIADLDIPALIREHEQVSNVDSLRILTFNALQQLTEAENNSIDRHVNQLITDLEPWIESSTELKSASDLLQDMSALTSEASSAIQKIQDKLEADPQRLAELDSLLGQLHDLARKHQIQIETLPDLYHDKQQQLESIHQGESNLDSMQTILAEMKERYRSKARELNTERLATAETLSRAVTDNMQLLGMQGGRFEIQVNFQMLRINSLHMDWMILCTWLAPIQASLYNPSTRWHPAVNYHVLAWRLL